MAHVAAPLRGGVQGAGGDVSKEWVIDFDGMVGRGRQVSIVEDRWHKWPEEKPPYEGRYLIVQERFTDADHLLSERNVYECHYERGRWPYRDRGMDIRVIHWRPLPDPPESTL